MDKIPKFRLLEIDFVKLAEKLTWYDYTDKNFYETKTSISEFPLGTLLKQSNGEIYLVGTADDDGCCYGRIIKFVQVAFLSEVLEKQNE